MIQGRVNASGEPVVAITIHGAARRTRISLILDTGFTGHVCLARRHRRAMSLTRLGDIETELADGTRLTQPVYAGVVTFDGERRRVLVTLTDSTDSLLGTALLRSKRVTIDFPRAHLTIR